jgi:hypothetical protein
MFIPAGCCHSRQLLLQLRQRLLLLLNPSLLQRMYEALNPTTNCLQHIGFRDGLLAAAKRQALLLLQWFACASCCCLLQWQQHVQEACLQQHLLSLQES